MAAMTALRDSVADVERFLAGEDTEFDLSETCGALIDAARSYLSILEKGEKVWHCALGTQTSGYLSVCGPERKSPGRGAGHPEGCGWRLLIPLRIGGDRL